MVLRSALGLGLLVAHTVISPAQATVYQDTLRIRGNASAAPQFLQTQTAPAWNQYHSQPQQRSYSDSTCMYRNPQGECMITQYFDPRTPRYENADRIRYNRVYNRHYLYHERKYANRDDDDSDDDDIYTYRYFSDDDDSGFSFDDDDHHHNDDDSFFDDDDDFDDDDSDDDDSDDDDSRRSSSDDDDDSSSDDDDDGRGSDDEDDEDDSSDDDSDHGSNDDEDDNDS